MSAPDSKEVFGLKLLDAHFAEFLTRFNLPKSFFGNLETDNDWSFIIKIHALIEMALNELVAGALGDNRLMPIITRLDTGDKQCGKLAFVKTLELLPKEARQFITTLSQLRNELAHDVKKVEFSLEDWVSNMKKDDLANFINSLNFDIEGKPTADKTLSSQKDRVRRLHPLVIRFFILDRCIKIVWRAVDYELVRDEAKLRKEADRLRGLMESYEAGKKSIPKGS